MWKGDDLLSMWKIIRLWLFTDTMFKNLYRLTEFPRCLEFFPHWHLKEDLKPNLELILVKWSGRLSAERRFLLIRRRCSPNRKWALLLSEALASSHRHRGGSSCPSEEGFSPSVVLILHPEYDMVNIHKKKLFPETWGLMGTCLEHWKKITNSRSQFF